MNDKNELSDIVLNKNGSSSSNKKIVLAIATLGIILIIVIVLMNSLSSQGTNNLPQAVLPPKPQAEVNLQENTQEPLFEDVEVVEEPQSNDTDLDKIAQKLKQESTQEEVEKTVAAPKKVIKEQTKTLHKPKTAKKQTAVSDIKYYIQVGSFSKYEPNKKFLKSITDLGYKYTYHKVTSNNKTLNKVLIGPFKTQKEADSAKRVIRAKIEPGAFLVKL